ncbi:MAG TPA: class II aldolase/adducin family protein [Solirubrobacteraceae bacterium]
MPARPGILPAERAAVAAACRRLAAGGLVYETSGNVSLRAGEHVAITPTGGRLAELADEDVCVVDLAGTLVDGALAPTSELDLHLGVYHRHGAGAVVHTHSPLATALGLVLDELPCVHYEMLGLGGTVPVAPYRTFGTPELAETVLDALEGRPAALMANHGAIVHGSDMDEAVRRAEGLERACELYWRAAAIGAPRTLDEQERRAVLDQALAREYGATRRA